MFRAYRLLSWPATAVLAFVLASCATPYAPTGLTGGVSVLPLDRETFEITVSGNQLTSRTRAQELALLAAADLTLQVGQTRFIIEENALKSQAAASPLARYSPLTLIQPNPTATSGSVTVRIVKSDGEDFTRGLDAQAIYDDLGPKYLDQPTF